ncbi:glycosyltransferase family 4 protein [Algoriphagus sp.]|uniref:glycosyltransferase family 4 protein n=1 Tax=Algoriphagus sp. TaxID=1872435 RepID=UPI003F71A21B
MRILVFYQYFGTTKGGWSTRIYEFTKRWVGKGHKVTVVTTPYYKSDIKSSQFYSKRIIDGIEVIIINTPDSNKNSLLKRSVFALIFSLVSVYFALTKAHDVVISSSGPMTTAIPGIASKVFRNKKFVFEIRDLWPKGGIELGMISNTSLIKFGLWFEKYCYKCADLVVACSIGMRQGVESVAPGTKTVVIPNSSDLALFGKRDGVPKGYPTFWQGEPLFIYAGSLGLMDDCRQFIEGIKTVAHLTFKVAIIGDGAQKEELIDLVRSYGLTDKVSFIGLLPKTEVVEWFGIACSSFVTFKNIAVLHTSSPNKMFDSFAAGVPIIQSTKGWIRELVYKYQCGINVDPEDPKSFGSAIRFILENPEKAMKYGENARFVAENLFDRNKLANLYLKEMCNLNP